MTQGPQKRVVNIGLGIKQLTVEPRGISVAVYLESLSHKVSLHSSATIFSGLIFP